MNGKEQTPSKRSIWLKPLVLLLVISFSGPIPAGYSNSRDVEKSSLGHLPGNNSSASTIVKNKGNSAHAVAQFVINAPPDKVWSSLTDFSNYPRIFSKIKTCQVTKKQGDLVWVESDLKPHMFVRKATNYTLNDLRGKPYVLDWQLLEGNFQSLKGKWQLSPTRDSNRCKVTYTLEIDPGPVIPSFLISYFLRSVQKRIVFELKNWVETDHPTESAKTVQQSDLRS